MQATSLWLRTSPFFSSTNAKRGVADLKYYNAEYCEWGSGQPLVLVPGLAGGVDLLEPLAQRLAERFHVIAFQSRGETDSFALRRRFYLRDLSEDVNEFIQWKGLERPFVAGVSFGAVVAVKFAASHPESLAALGLQGVGLRFESGLVQRIADLVLSSYPLPGDCRFVNQFFGLLFGHRPAPEQLAHVAHTCWQTDQGVMSRRLRLLRRLNLEDYLGRITAPTLLLGGERDMLVSAENTQQLLAGLAKGRFASLERAGHLAPVSHTSEMAEAFGQFFSEFSA
jgi:pimeloyl-ACP methyl ester carboxylesterase